jgi:hypothetical protein
MKLTFDIIARSGLTDDKVVNAPEVLNAKMRANAGTPLEDPTPYRQLIGPLTYLSVTQPDIMHVVHNAS